MTAVLDVHADLPLLVMEVFLPLHVPAKGEAAVAADATDVDSDASKGSEGTHNCIHSHRRLVCSASCVQRRRLRRRRWQRNSVRRTDRQTAVAGDSMCGRTGEASARHLHMMDVSHVLLVTRERRKSCLLSSSLCSQDAGVWVPVTDHLRRSSSCVPSFS